MKILAVSSPGGHLAQLKLALEKWPDQDIVFVIAGKGQDQVPDFNLRTFWHLPGCVLRAYSIIKKIQPTVVISTGAAPGCCFLITAFFLKTHTVWIDSLANTEKLSLSGRLVKPFADLHLTQWPHLAKGSTLYLGACF